jgi:hypothetical protein
MSLEKRLEQLEKQFRSGEQANPGGGTSTRSMERYFHELENSRREQYGLEPLDDLPYTKEDYEDDLTTLNEHIPTMRLEPGWQAGEGKAFLDQWERHVKQRIEGNQ